MEQARTRAERGSVQIALLLSAVAAAAVLVAARTAERAWGRQAERAALARRRVAEVAEAARAHYLAHLALPSSLGALVTGGHLDVEDTFDPCAPERTLRLVRQGARGHVTCASRGRNRIQENGGGDDIVAEVEAVLPGAQLTRERGRRIARIVEARITLRRGAAELSAANALRWAEAQSSRTWLEDHREASDWHVRFAQHVALLATALSSAAGDAGRGAPGLEAAVDAITGDAGALATAGSAGARGTLTATGVAALGLDPAAARFVRACLLSLDDLQRARHAGITASAAWRARTLVRFDGLHERTLAALFEAQDGDGGLQHPLAGHRSVRAEVTGLGLPPEFRRDGHARAWRLEVAPALGFRSAGADGTFGTADDTVHGGW